MRQEYFPNPLAEAIGAYWLISADGDPRVSAIFKRHYSCKKYGDGRRNQTQYRNRHLVVGPGEKLVLLSADCRAIFGWRKFIDQSGQTGVNCAFFRNEGAFDGVVQSSELILAAERLAWAKWPGERLYTYVDADKTEKRRSKHKPPGACFVHAGLDGAGRKDSGEGSGDFGEVAAGNDGRRKVKSMARKVIIEVAGIQEVHATHFNGNYASLCGLDGDDDDPAVNQRIIGNAGPGAKIDCKECRDIIIHARAYDLSDLGKSKR